MDNSISSEMEARMRALCDDIASAEDLNSDLHDELYTHIEEKVLGYLSGEETLSEADAYLLAREHFGDRATMRDQLEEVHLVEVPFNMYRRLALVMMLTMGLSVCLALVMGTIGVVINLLPVSAVARDNIAVVATILSSLIYFGIQFKILHTWKLMEAQGNSNWYQSWSTGKLYTLLMPLALFSTLAGVIQKALLFPTMQSFIPVTPLGKFFWLLYTLILIGGMAMTWLMWLDVRPHPKGTLFRTVLAFSLFYGFLATVSGVFQVRPSPLAESDPEYIPAIGSLLLKLEHCAIYFQTQDIPIQFVVVMLFMLIAIFVAWIPYTLWIRYRNRPNNGSSNLALAK